MAKKNQNKQRKPRKPVPRHTRKYQFRNDHPVDQHVDSILNYWKGGKQEITNLRKAVALYYALEQGDLQQLFTAFPQYKAQFAPNTAVALEQFMQILQRQQAPLPEPPAGPRQIAAPSFAMPVFEEDDEPTVLIRASSSNDSALNFVTALRNMQ